MVDFQMLNLCCDDKEKKGSKEKSEGVCLQRWNLVVMLFVLQRGWAELLYNLHTLQKEQVSFIWIQYLEVSQSEEQYKY